MNVRPAPFALNEQTVSALVEGRESRLGMSGVVAVPVLKLRLVNLPRRSEDPRLARGNDNPGSAGGPDFLGGADA